MKKLLIITFSMLSTIPLFAGPARANFHLRNKSSAMVTVHTKGYGPVVIKPGENKDFGHAYAAQAQQGNRYAETFGIQMDQDPILRFTIIVDFNWIGIAEKTNISIPELLPGFKIKKPEERSLSNMDAIIEVYDA